MKRKQATCPEWERLLVRRFATTAWADEAFSGQLALLAFDAVAAPGWLECAGQRLRIADAGYCWLQFFPDDERYDICAMLDARGQLVCWYFDIIKGYGIDADGIPWYDDLYLDLVILPDGATHVLDADELDEALTDGKITATDWHLAWDALRRLQADLAGGPLPAMTRAADYLAALRALPMQTLTREDPRPATTHPPRDDGDPANIVEGE